MALGGCVQGTNERTLQVDLVVAEVRVGYGMFLAVKLIYLLPRPLACAIG